MTNIELSRKVDELYAWMQEKKHQQIGEPLDEASKYSLSASLLVGAGTTAATHVISIGAGGGSATVPVNPLGTIVIQLQGQRYEVPYIAKS